MNTTNGATCQPKQGRKAKGDKGEELATTYLRRLGYQILERQWHHGHLELDIIAQDTETGEVVFVEVRSRADSKWGDPEDSIDMRKIRRICNAANHYLTSHNVRADYRFDIIAVLLEDGPTPRLTHYKDAFYPPLQH